MSDDHQHSPLSRADTPIPNPMGRGTSAVDGIDIDAETEGTTETLSLNRLVLTEVKSDDPSRTEIPRSPSISIASDRSSHNSSTPSDTVVFSERSRRQGIEREAVPTGILLSGRDQARKEAIEATKKALDEASDRAKRDIQEIEERHRKKLAEIDLTQSTPPSTPQPAATEPQVQVKREATGPTTPSVKRESAATSGQATAPITPLRLYPNPDPAQSKVVQRAYSTGVDLNALAAAFEGKTLRAQADKPQKFSGQPLIGLPPSGHVSLYKDTKPKQTFNEWVGSVDLYFALCGMKRRESVFPVCIELTGRSSTNIHRGCNEETKRHDREYSDVEWQWRRWRQGGTFYMELVEGDTETTLPASTEKSNGEGSVENAQARGKGECDCILSEVYLLCHPAGFR